MDIRFPTNNSRKLDEYRTLFAGSGHRVLQDESGIDEIQSDDIEKLVRDKVVKAFGRIRCPVFVDHTGLYFDLLGGFPGGLTQIFWNKIGNAGIAKLIGRSGKPQVKAVTVIGYCDGRKIRLFRGEIDGTVPGEPRGPENFQWDTVFQPSGCDRTFAEMGEEKKNRISMRRKATDRFLEYLNTADQR